MSSGRDTRADAASAAGSTRARDRRRRADGLGGARRTRGDPRHPGRRSCSSTDRAARGSRPWPTPFGRSGPVRPRCWCDSTTSTPAGTVSSVPATRSPGRSCVGVVEATSDAGGDGTGPVIGRVRSSGCIPAGRSSSRDAAHSRPAQTHPTRCASGSMRPTRCADGEPSIATTVPTTRSGTCGSASGVGTCTAPRPSALPESASAPRPTDGSSRSPSRARLLCTPDREG